MQYSFGDTLGDDGNRLDLGVLHQFHGGAVYTSGRGKVDNGIDVWMFGNGLPDGLIDGE